jgi:lipocalin
MIPTHDVIALLTRTFRMSEEEILELMRKVLKERGYDVRRAT